jgi:hypothetical protein
MSIENPTLAHFRHISHFSSLYYNIFPDTPNYAKQTQFQKSQINISSYMESNNEKMDNWLFRKTNPNKPNSKPKQTQLIQRVKMMQSMYLQRITMKNANIGPKKQTQFKANSNPILNAAASFIYDGRTLCLPTQ